MNMFLKLKRMTSLMLLKKNTRGRGPPRVPAGAPRAPGLLT